MATTEIQVAGRTFEVGVKAHPNDDTYRCYFHEMWWRGFYSSNKNWTYKQEEDVYGWFKEMVEKHLPQTDSEEVLESAVSKLAEEFEGVERKS